MSGRAYSTNRWVPKCRLMFYVWVVSLCCNWHKSFFGIFLFSLLKLTFKVLGSNENGISSFSNMISESVNMQASMKPNGANYLLVERAKKNLNKQIKT